MPTQIIQLSTTAAHILALDSTGTIWWRRWDKKGWTKMEQVPLPSSTVPVTPTPEPVNAGPVITTMPPIVPPVVIPQPPIQAPDMKTIDSLVHKDPA